MVGENREVHEDYEESEHHKHKTTHSTYHQLTQKPRLPFSYLITYHLPGKRVTTCNLPLHTIESTPPEITNAEWHMWIIRERRLRREREDTYLQTFKTQR